MDYDQYQQEHSKNFRYRYYPPKLVELELESKSDHSGDHNMPMHHHRGHGGGRSIFMWCTIIVIILLASFLMLGFITMQKKGNARVNAKVNAKINAK